MNIISRYLIKRLTVMSCYALLAILALYSFIDFLNEVGNIGKGSYTFWTAVQYIAMQMPARAYQLMPLATLIGGLIALSQLSNNSEWAVIKTSGLSTKQLIGIVLQFSLIFALATAVLGEWLAPKLSQRADTMKAIAKTGQISAVNNGVWLKQPYAMVNISSMLPDKTLLDINIWRYNDAFQLTEVLAAERAKIVNNMWLLQQVKSSKISEDKIETSQQAQLDWQMPIDEKLLAVLRVEPEQMSFSALSAYIRYLKNNAQQTQMYEVAWWNKLIYPIATMVMALVALAFTPISSRHTNMGLKLFGGICLGLLFFFTGRLFGFTTQLYHVPAFFSAVLPTAVFAVLAIYFIRKQEQR